MSSTRRGFLRAGACAGLFGSLTDWRGLLPLSSARAADVEVTPDMVRFDGEIEPLVTLIESTPREECPAMMIARLRQGVSYRQFLAALFLAGIRNVNPQPPGFKFHCVFVIHAAHQLSLDAPVGERLLPLFWALDEFKKSQAEDVAQGDFRLRPVTGSLPSPEQAWPEFHAAMEAWDEPRADRAIVALARSRGAHEVIDGLWQYGARDYRNIGHKAIFVANAWRTLQTIGWQHAEPVLRSIVLALLDFKQTEVNGYTFASQSYTGNVVRARETVGKLPANWSASGGDARGTRELLDVLRTGELDAISSVAATMLQSGACGAQECWDAAHLAAGELMMRQPGIYGIHTVTSINALHYAFRAAARPELRLLLLFQGLGWMGQFRNFMASRPNGLNETRITDLVPGAIDAKPEAAAERIFATLSRDPAAAAPLAFGWSKTHHDPSVFARLARELVFRKASDAHHYKYAAAIFEDHDLVSPEWRPHLLATSVYYLRGSEAPDSPLMRNVRESLRTL
jgi:hypothetical protein